MRYYFEWDPKKAKGNLKKHKVSFERGATQQINNEEYKIRVISARKATRKEAKQYGEENI